VCRSTTDSSAAAPRRLVELGLRTAPLGRSQTGGQPPGGPGQPAGDVVTPLGRLAGEDEPPAGLEDPQYLPERLLVRRGCDAARRADDQVERRVVVRDPLSVGHPSLDVEAEVVGVALRDLDHARAQVGDVPLIENPGELEV